MEGNGVHDSDRRRLIIPISIVIAAGWTAALVRALIVGDVEVLIIASAPFSLLCGYMFGTRFTREG